jgi:hypothetical protein
MRAIELALTDIYFFPLCFNKREQKVLLQQEMMLLKNKRHSSGIPRIDSREALP